MKKIAPVIWIAASLLFALSFAVVTGMINPGEKINAIWIIVAAATFYAIAYRFYGAFLAAKVVTFNDDVITPPTGLMTAETSIPPTSGFSSAITSRPSPAPAL